MNFPIQINTIAMGLSVIYFKGSRVEICKLRCTSVVKDCFCRSKSADPDEMRCFAAFYLCLHCLPKYPFRGF